MADIDRLQDRQFYTGDPLLRLLRDKLHLQDGWIIAGSAMLMGLALFGVPALFGFASDLKDLVIGSLETLLIIPLGMLIYVSLPNVFDDLFNTLLDNNVIGPRRKDVSGPTSYQAFLNDLVFQANRRVWVVGALGVATAYGVYRLSGHVSGDTTAVGTPAQQLAQRLALLVVYAPALYGAFLSIVRLLIALVFSVRLFRTFHIQVNPLHPDGAGGLAIIGHLLTINVLLATVIGAAAVAMALLQLAAGINPLWRVETLLFGAVYAVLTPLILNSWLWVPHRAMQAARDQVLLPLADEYQQAIRRSMPAAQDDAASVKAGTDKLDEIKRRYDLLQAGFPTFPVGTLVSRSLIATSLLPALSTLVSGLIPSVQAALVRLFTPQ
jgi:hypothetical protein